MAHVSELVTHQPTASEPRTTSDGRLSADHIALLWERMAGMYSHRWTSSYGVKDDGTWLKGLSDITPEQVVVGLEQCRTTGDEWPPTLPVFRARCLVRPFAAPYHKPFPRALPRPPGNPEVAHRHLGKMKALLAKPARYAMRPVEIVKPLNDDEANAERRAIQQEGA